MRVTPALHGWMIETLNATCCRINFFLHESLIEMHKKPLISTWTRGAEWLVMHVTPRAPRATHEHWKWMRRNWWWKKVIFSSCACKLNLFQFRPVILWTNQRQQCSCEYMSVKCQAYQEVNFTRLDTSRVKKGSLIFTFSLTCMSAWEVYLTSLWHTCHLPPGSKVTLFPSSFDLNWYELSYSHDCWLICCLRRTALCNHQFIQLLLSLFSPSFNCVYTCPSNLLGTLLIDSLVHSYLGKWVTQCIGYKTHWSSTSVSMCDALVYDPVTLQ